MEQDHLHAYAPKAYDALAPFYEHHWGPAFLDDAIGLFNQILGSRVPAGSHVLDLCCGSGHFAAWLSSNGLCVTGVDASNSMIDYARRKAPRSQFYVADMKSFRIPAVFDAAVCFYNSINQVLTLNGLRATLRSVGRHLRPGGWFLFDIVLEDGYVRSWNADESIVCDGRSYELTYRYNEQERLASCRVTVRDPAAEFDARSWELHQRPYPVSLLLSELLELGFDLAQVTRATDISPSGSRVAVVARRAPDLDHQTKSIPAASTQNDCQEKENA